MTEFSRRDLLVSSAALLAQQSLRAQTAPVQLKVAIFSKHLQFLRGEDLAAKAAEMGFDGVDITVRAGGHVEPARVGEELPPLVDLIRKHGLQVPMVTTDIVDANTPYALPVVETLNKLGIRFYRWGGLKWANGQPFDQQIEGFKPRVAKLAALNAQHGVTAMYHTHSGVGVVGASIWDLHEILRDLDPAAVAVNYDPAHATVEGGEGGWIDSFHITGRHLRGIAVKDFEWQRSERGWAPAWKPLGQGMVRLPKFFSMVREAGFNGPLQLHFEYPLGGAEDGKRQLAIPREEVFTAMKRDLRTLRALLRDAGLA